MKSDLDAYGPVADSGATDWFLEKSYGTNLLTGKEMKRFENWQSLTARAPILVYDREMEKLKKEANELRTKLEEHLLSEHSLIDSTGSNCITVRNIPVQQAEEEIEKYFLDNDGREIDYDELIEELCIEPQIVISVCQALEESGKIG